MEIKKYVTICELFRLIKEMKRFFALIRPYKKNYY